ncbi:hypothetical protein ACVBEQ_11250 [Nakamurella sp. GG22]
MSGPVTATYVGQVERDSTGLLWAVLYCGEHVVSREQVRSLRKGKKRVADLVLSASDAFVELQRSSPVHLNRFVEQRPLVRRNRGAMGAAREHLTAASAESGRRERLVSP